MPIKILMPALSPTMTEGNIAKWLKKEGDKVRSGDVIAEIETDKATMEVEAADDGVLGKIVEPAGAQGVKVNSVIGMLLSEGEDASSIGSVEKSPPAQGATPKTEPAPTATAALKQQPAQAQVQPAQRGGNGEIAATPLARRMAGQAGVDLAAVQGTGAHGKVTRDDVTAAARGGAQGTTQTAGDGGRVMASPLAMRMAAQAGLDLRTMKGSGPEGRIVKRDIEQAIAGPRARQMPPVGAPAARPATPQPSRPGETFTRVPLSTMRKVIAERMAYSKSTVPHFYLSMDAEIDELLKVRAALNERNTDTKLSVNDFVIKACAQALREVPQANATWDDGAVRLYTVVDIAVAVALDEGLITPVMRDADQKGLAQISAEMKDLAARAKSRKLMPEEYQGGSFTISNLGMYGVKDFQAIINPPQAAILAVGAGEKRPVVKDGALAVATVMTLTLSVDHRVIDGAIGAKLLAAIKRLVEYPPSMLM
jgi:pyruvate dehydrogenase E2 component (dihydrolipoamide acetyltransferase)